jgi:uncharacterized protein DUF5818
MRKLGMIATLAYCMTMAFSTGAKVTAWNPADSVTHTRTSGTDQDKSEPGLRIFAGTITKNGEQFVLNESNTHKLYELDDQVAASKFANQNVTITGTLDAVKNIIRIESIAEAAT